MKKLFSCTGLAALCLACTAPTPEKEFARLERLPWREVLADDLTGDYAPNWHLDGRVGTATPTPQGLEMKAGPTEGDDACHMVLWTRREFRGELKVSYDFTRLDRSPANAVNILYLHATGSGEGPYAADIARWDSLRAVPAMKTNFDHMNAYHVSYAVSDLPRPDYLRGRRYMPLAGRGLEGTELTPEYLDTGLFQPGVPHRIEVILHPGKLYMQVSNDRASCLFRFDTASHPALTEGRIGLRVMWTRHSRFANFRVCEL